LIIRLARFSNSWVIPLSFPIPPTHTMQPHAYPSREVALYSRSRRRVQPEFYARRVNKQGATPWRSEIARGKAGVSLDWGREAWDPGTLRSAPGSVDRGESDGTIVSGE